jgi:hypothetical protein
MAADQCGGPGGRSARVASASSFEFENRRLVVGENWMQPSASRVLAAARRDKVVVTIWARSADSGENLKNKASGRRQMNSLELLHARPFVGGTFRRGAPSVRPSIRPSNGLRACQNRGAATKDYHQPAERSVGLISFKWAEARLY